MHATDNKIIIYVSSCQNNEISRFTTYVKPEATLFDIQMFLADQWKISNHPFSKIPLSEHTFTFNGKLLRIHANIDLYDISFQDEIWIRFSSHGDVTEPLAMSADELRHELQQRNAYKKNNTPEELMQTLQEEIWKETRLNRLGDAMRKGNEELVKKIKNELVVIEKRKKKQREENAVSPVVTRPKSTRWWPIPPTKSRFFFLSITDLELNYERIPRDVLQSSVLIFDTERKWVFSSQNFLLLDGEENAYNGFFPPLFYRVR